MSSTYRKTLDTWLGQLDVKADKVLDIGGSQQSVKGRTKSWEVDCYKIADMHEPHVDSPKPDVILDLNRYYPSLKTYDLIFCLEVFDYIFDPMEAFRTLHKLLKEDGTAWVTFPAFYPHHNPIEDDALNYKEYGIRKLADITGLKIAQMIPRRPQTNALEQYFAAEGLRAAKGYDHNVYGWIVEFTK